jgi:hypothetical protein
MAQFKGKNNLFYRRNPRDSCAMYLTNLIVLMTLNNNFFIAGKMTAFHWS